ncbi:Na+ antiporter NhaC [Acetomicrobium mobile DSM 13181]|uniref:Na+ antiporter NhaC n=2 Tax=Acetomicrobium TaxID=49894 RepID=I4BXY0_ACEMN|nr:Na+/H+ antiporter NhaC [Acetomicrobium mobile]AFM22137.1 Na+ antiporter NhaC [Acetomicrobium mobile DSM 13181]
MPEAEVPSRKPTLFEAIVAIAAAALCIGIGVLVLGVDVHVPLVFATAFVCLMGRYLLHFQWKDMEDGIFRGILAGLQAVLILMIVGMIIGSWIQGGVVPTLIYYGLSLLSPAIFLLATLLICSIVSLATGTSWGTSGTVGLALMGIAAGLGVPAPLAAGVVISGAYFGDKMSPLSDTTNLAPAVAGTTLFSHIRAMISTTMITYAIVIIITLVIGFKFAGGTLDVSRIQAFQKLLATEFHISPLGFIPPIVVILLAALRFPAIPSLFAGVVLGSIMILFQGSGLATMVTAIHYGYTPVLSAEIAGAESLDAVSALLASKGITDVAPELAKEVAQMLSELLQRGGLDSMMWTVSLIFCALSFGGVMERCGFLEVLLDSLLRHVESVTGLITSVIFACIFTNILLADQYVAIVLPGRMFKSAFDKKGLHPRMLSRTLEDSGTLTSVLVPWNTCGAYHTGVLGVPTLQYLPYAFLNYLNPIVAIVLTAMGKFIFWRKETDEDVINV